MKIRMWFHKYFGSCLWKKIGPTEPIKAKDEFNENVVHKALAECSLCGKKKFREVSGAFHWKSHEELTEEEYLEKHNLQK